MLRSEAAVGGVIRLSTVTKAHVAWQVDLGRRGNGEGQAFPAHRRGGEGGMMIMAKHGACLARSMAGSPRDAIPTIYRRPKHSWTREGKAAWTRARV